MTNLSDNDRALLAREVAADRYVQERGNDERRRLGFLRGWDMAMTYVEERQRKEAAKCAESEIESKD